MRILFLSAFVLTVSVGAIAQTNNSIGISLGTSFSKINDSHGEDYFRPGFTGAIQYQRCFGWFVAEGALDYTQKGGRERVTYTDQNGQTLAQQNLDYVFHYVGLSLKGGIRYGDRIFGITTIGVTPALLVRPEYHSGEMNINGDVYPAQRQKIEEVSKFDLSLNLETSLGYRIGERSALLLTLNASAGLVNIEQKDPYYFYFPPTTWKNNYFTAKLGYQYSF